MLQAIKIVLKNVKLWLVSEFIKTVKFLTQNIGCLKTKGYLSNNAFSSVASSAFILPANTKLNCFRLNAAAKRSFSRGVSGVSSGTLTGFPI